MINIEVRRSITIQCHHSEALSIISDLRTWPQWSPWLKIEPSCTIEFHGSQKEIGASYLWHGKLIGSGNITLIDRGVDFLLFELHFLLPHKLEAFVTFEALEHEEGTTITWIMKSKLPWYSFLFKKSIQNNIKLDFRRGLLMLKQYIESSHVNSNINFLGISEQEPINYIGLKGRAKLEYIESTFNDNLAKIDQFLNKKNINWQYPIFLLLEEVDKESTESEFFVCVPLESKINVSAPFICDKLTPQKILTVEHKGDYQFIGNAWSLASHEAQYKKLKTLNNPTGLEWYSNNPNFIKRQEIESQVRLFIK